MKRWLIDAHKQPRRPFNAFTLVEVLVSVAMFAIIILALNTVLYAALNLRDKAYDSIRADMTTNRTLSIMKRDLINLVPPNGTLTGEFLGEQNNDRYGRNDSLLFYSSTGNWNENVPWGDVQRIEYVLMDLERENEEEARYLVRLVTRNLLSTLEEEPEIQPLLKHVDSLEFSYFDGESWLPTWDSNEEDPPLPEAVRISISYQKEYQISRQQENKTVQDASHLTPYMIDMIVPIVSQPWPQEEENEASESNENSNQEEQNEPSSNNPSGGRA